MVPTAKQYVMPDLGLWAVQGHSTLFAAPEKLRAEQEDLLVVCVHGTDHTT